MHPYPLPPRRGRPAWLLPILILAGAAFVVCLGVTTLGALITPTSTDTSKSAQPRGFLVVNGNPNGAQPLPAPGDTADIPPASATPGPITPSPTPTLRATTHPTTHNIAPTPTRRPTPKPKPDTCGAPANPWGLNFCGHGHTMTVSELPSGVCSYFACIDNFFNGHGYMIECSDGTYSMSGGISGRCSYHGGDGHETVYRP
jgi:hypothetical protein